MIKRNKLFGISIVVLLLGVFYSYFSYSASGCCLNPLAQDFYCTYEADASYCCPSDINYPSYYYDEVLHPYGPRVEEDCLNLPEDGGPVYPSPEYPPGQGYFAQGADCAPYANDYCTVTCCCGEALGDDAIEIERGICISIGGEAFEGADCAAIECEFSEDIPEGDCDNPGFIPSIIGLEADSIKGEKQFQLTWGDECVALSYTVNRREFGENDWIKIADDVIEKSYVDDSFDLLWESEYEYMVEGEYDIPQDSSAQTIGDMGDLECWGQYDDNKMCLHTNTYMQSEIRDYLIDNYPETFNEDNYQTAIEAEFGDKTNGAYRCNSNNLLSDPALLMCSDDNFCVIDDDGEPFCAESSSCEPENFLDNPFGFYYTEDECYLQGFCYYDSGKTTQNKCYSCRAGQMNCYDYKSSDACETDQCSAANNNCEWVPLIDELGVGVCIDANRDNCEWCDESGTSIPDVGSFNTVLASCSPEKAEALSTDGNTCFYNEGAAISCSEVNCLDIDECSVTDPDLGIDNTVLNTGGICDLNVCKDIESVCRKDANDDGAPDCDGLEEEELENCELDHYPPETIIDLIDDDGIIIGFNVVISDRIHNEVVYPEYPRDDYITKYCIDRPGSDCSFVYGTDYIIASPDTQMTINGLAFYDAHTGIQRSVLEEGMNTIYYFTEDPTQNLGIVGSFEVEAHANNTRPDLYLIKVNGREANDEVFYTNLGTLGIELFFYEGALLTEFQIRDENAEIIATFEDYFIVPDPDYTVLEYILTPLEQNLSDGEYSILLDAENENMRNLPTSQQEYTAVIDRTLTEVNITPPFTDFCRDNYWESECIINETLVSVSFDFERDVLIDYVLIGEDDYTEIYFSEDYKNSYSALLNLSDGVKNVNLQAHDLFDNLINGFATFIVNAHPPEIGSVWIDTPSYGVSSTNTFELVVASENFLECRYRLDFDIDFNNMNLFDETDSDRHIVNNFVINDEAPHTLFVRCKDVYWRPDPYLFVFDLSVDTSPPVIKDYFTFPSSPIAELPINLTITVETVKDEVLCRYSETDQPYDSMGNEFFNFEDDDFRTIKNAYIWFDEDNDGSYTYYVACQNMAELTSATFPISFTIDTGQPLDIISHMDEFYPSMQVELNIETNKGATCFYGLTEGAENIEMEGLLEGHSHRKTITSPSEEYQVYFLCLATGETATEDLTIKIDVSAPVMEYVNDSSLLEGAPEFTPHQDKIFVKWYSTDEQTGDRGLFYNFTLVEKLTQDTVVNWTDNFDLQYLNNNLFEGWISEDQYGTPLNLTNGVEYIFKVISENIVGHVSIELASDGVTTNFSYETSCTNGILDGSETDIDCGGDCDACDLGQECSGNFDCSSGYCNEDDICSEPSCDDDIENGNESDTDCGGSECDECELGEYCSEDEDCEAGLDCSQGICKEPDSCNDGSLSPGETDIDCGGICSNACGEGEYCENDLDCESGLECTGGICKRVIFDDFEDDSDGDGIPDSWEDQNGLDSNDASDAALDFDGDGLDNFNEYLYNTDPNDKDTDGDGHSDKVEIDKGSDPLDPDSKPGSSWRIILYILLILLILGVIGYLVYIQYFKKKKTISTSPSPSFPLKPMPTAQRARPTPYRMRGKRDTKEKSRHSAFSAFSGKEDEKKPVNTETEKVVEPKEGEYIDLTTQRTTQKEKVKEPSPDVFKKLSKIIDKDKKEKGVLEKIPEKVADKSEISKLSKQASKQIKKDLEQHKEKLDGKLDKIEKKVAVITKKKAKPFYATKTGTKYHKSNCITLKDQSKSKLRKFTSKNACQKAGLKPCSVCNLKKK